MQLNMGVSKPIFTCIRTKAVDNVQRWVNRGSDMLQSIEKQMTMKDYLLFSPFVCFNLGNVIKVSGQTSVTVKFNF